MWPSRPGRPTRTAGSSFGNGNDGRKITVRELRQQTSGLHNYTDDLQAQITSVDAYRELEFHHGDVATVPGSRYGLGIFSVPLSCGGVYWSHEGDVPGYNTVSGVSADGRRTVVRSINSNVDDPTLDAEYALVDHAMCAR